MNSLLGKLKSWLIPALVVILIISGIVYIRGRFFVVQPGPGYEITEEQPKGFAKPLEPSAQEKAKSDSEAMKDALLSGDISDCDKITWDEELKQRCLDNLNYAAFIRQGDERKCEEIANEDLKQMCYDNIYFATAVDTKDASLCQKIKDTTMKQQCLDQVQALLARRAASAEDCNSIESEILKSQCLDNYYLTSSAKNMDLQSCNNISDPTLKEKCSDTVTQNIQVAEVSKQAAAAKKVTKTPAEILVLCDTLNESQRDACKDSIYPRLAFEEKNLTYCDKISDPVKVMDCREEQEERIDQYFMRQAIALQDNSECSKISNSELKELCFSSF